MPVQGFSSNICSLMFYCLDLWVVTVDGPLARNLVTLGEARRKVAALGLFDMFWSQMERVWANLWETRVYLADNVANDSTVLERLQFMAFAARQLENMYVRQGLSGGNMLRYSEAFR